MIDLILCGPLGILKYERKFFFVCALVLCIAHFMKFSSFSASGFRIPILTLFLVSLIWLIPIPLIYSDILQLSFEEWDAFIFLLIPIFYIPSKNEAARLLKLVFFCTTVLSLFIFISWLCGSQNQDDFDKIRKLFSMVYSDRSLFIGNANQEIGDFFPRIFFVNMLWIFVCFLMMPVFSGNKYISLFLGVILCAGMIISYSRGLWIAYFVALLSISILSIKNFRFLFILFISSFFLASLFFTNQSHFLTQRIASLNYILETTGPADHKATRPPDLSADTRKLQMGYLINSWRDAKFFGKGWGAYAKDFSGSVESNYSYEAVPFALLLKIGIVGVLMAIIWIASFIFRATSLASRRFVSVLIGVFTFLVVGGMTNPYIFNFIGMGIFVFVLLIFMNIEFEENLIE
jgi:hypothetical protein